MLLTLRLTALAAAITAAVASCPSLEWKQFGDKCYWKSDYTLNGRSVAAVCGGMVPGAEAVSVHNVTLDAFLVDNLLNGVEAWLGLYRAGDSDPWIWTDASTFNYTNWYHGDPLWPGEACATINYDTIGSWTGWECDDRYYYFLCQIDA